MKKKNKLALMLTMFLGAAVVSQGISVNAIAGEAEEIADWVSEKEETVENSFEEFISEEDDFSSNSNMPAENQEEAEYIFSDGEQSETDEIKESDTEAENTVKNVEVSLKSKYFVNIDRLTYDDIKLKAEYSNGEVYDVNSWAAEIKVQRNTGEDEAGEESIALTKDGIDLNQAGSYKIIVEYDGVVIEKLIEVVDLSLETLTEIKENRSFNVSGGSEIFYFTPENDGYYYLSTGVETISADIIDINTKSVTELKMCYLTKGQKYIFRYEGEAGSALIENRPQLQSISLKNDDRIPEYCYTAASIPCWTLVGQYANGESYDIGEQDYWGNDVLRRIKDSAGNYVDDNKILASGDYILEVTINDGKSKAVNMPIHIYSLQEWSTQTLVTGKRQSIKTEEKERCAIFSYRPEADGRYYIQIPNMWDTHIEGKDENGQKISNMKAHSVDSYRDSYLDSYVDGYFVSLTGGKTYYMAIFDDDTDSLCDSSFSMLIYRVAEKEIKSADLRCSQTCYARTEKIYFKDFYLNVEYKDGSSQEIQWPKATDDGDYFSLELENLKTHKKISNGYAVNPDETGEYVMKAYWDGQDTPIAQLSLQVNDIEPGKLKEIKAEVPFHVDGKNGEEIFYFKPEESGKYYVSGISDKSEIKCYIYDAKTGTISYSDIKEKNKDYIIRYLGSNSTDLTVSKYPEGSHGGWEISQDVFYDNLVIDETTNKETFSFVPKETGLYEINIKAKDGLALETEIGEDVFYRKSKIQRILKQGVEYEIKVSCIEEYYDICCFCMEVKKVKDKSVLPTDINIMDSVTPGQIGVEGCDTLESLVKIRFDYDETVPDFSGTKTKVGEKWHVGENTDEYGNKYTITVDDISNTPSIKKEYRFKIVCGEITKERYIVLYNSARIESIVLGEQKKVNYGQKNEETKITWCYEFTPSEDGYYNLFLDSAKNITAICTGVYEKNGEEAEYYYKQYGGYRLKKGKTYYMKISGTACGQGAAKISVDYCKNKEIANLMVIPGVEASYAVYGLIEPGFSGTKIKITYADNTQETVDAGAYSGTGKKFRTSVIWSDNKKSYRIEYYYRWLEDVKKYTTVLKNEIPVISETKNQKLDFGKELNKRIVKIQPVQDGTYSVLLKSKKSYSYYFMDENGKKIDDSNGKVSLKKANQYYAVIYASGLQEVSLKDESHVHKYVWFIDKKATCKEAGRKHEECTECHEKTGITEIPRTNDHQFGDYKMTKAPTVFKNGTASHKCAICGKTESTVIKKIPAKITISSKKITVAVGKTVTGPKVSFEKGDSIKNWKSAKKSIATVAKNGKITGKKAGKTTITVTLKSKKKATFTVNVVKKIPTTSLKVNKKTLQIKKGKSYQLKVTVKPVNTTDKLKYKSSNTKVLSVNSKGKIKAKKKGKATVTITSGKKKVTCKVVVK